MNLRRARIEISSREWKGAHGLAKTCGITAHGWQEAEKRIGHLYPRVEVDAEMAGDRT